MRVVFIGTSEFAVPTLKQLHSSSHDIVAIITQPDRPKGRGRKLTQPPVKKTAIELGYKVSQPSKINENKFVSKIKILAPDLLVVVAYGQILCNRLLEIPKKGAINVHPSLIPKYRGPAPIQWAIINGDSMTGVTTMFMNSITDTGSMLLSKTTGISPIETSACLHDRLAMIGSELLLETLEKILDNSLNPIPQNCKHATMAPLLKKKDGEINWRNPARKIESFIRGMNPWPGAFTFYKGKRLKIVDASVVESDCEKVPGTVLDCHNSALHIATEKHVISVKWIQNESGKKLPIDAFLCGCQFSNGSVLGSSENK